MALPPRVVKEIEQFKERKLAEATEAAFDTILRNWPVWTGWSKAHNKVTFGPTPLLPAVPDKPSEQPGAFRALEIQNRAQQRSKIEALREATLLEVDSVTIANAVPYARDVGNENNRGVRIYRAAARRAAEAV